MWCTSLIPCILLGLGLSVSRSCYWYILCNEWYSWYKKPKTESEAMLGYLSVCQINAPHTVWMLHQNLARDKRNYHCEQTTEYTLVKLSYLITLSMCTLAAHHAKTSAIWIWISEFFPRKCSSSQVFIDIKYENYLI